MIPSTHLRIGNWVNANVMKLYPDDRPNYEPAQIQRLPEDAGATHSPIELSTEILEKAGFEKKGDDFWLRDDYLFRNNILYYFHDDCPNEYHARMIKPELHWLQNHYFFTFHVELEINL